MRAALIIREPDGTLIDVGAPINVDPDSVAREVKRLRGQFGRRVYLDGTMVRSAQLALLEREARLGT